MFFAISDQQADSLDDQYVMWINLANVPFERSCSSPFDYKNQYFYIFHILELRMCSTVQGRGNDSFSHLKSFWGPIIFFSEKMTTCEWNNSVPIKYWILNSERTFYHYIQHRICYLEELFSLIFFLVFLFFSSYDCWSNTSRYFCILLSNYSW